MSKKKKPDVSSELQKELQGILITVAFSQVYSQKRTSNERKKVDVYNLVHGNDDNPNMISLIDQMLRASGPFEGMFDKVNAGVGKGDVFHLKDCLTRDNTTKLILGKHITSDILRFSTLTAKTLLQKTTMWGRGSIIFRNAKKAMSFSKDKVVFDGSRPPDFLPSGKNIGDWENHVLKSVKRFG